MKHAVIAVLLIAALAGIVMTACPNQPVSVDYELIFDPNGGSGSMEALLLAEGETAPLSLNAFSLANHRFSGWGTGPHGPLAYQDGADFTMASKGRTLYALWTLNSTNIVFNPNGGEGSMSPQQVDIGGTITLKANRFTRVGYNFLGWSIGSSTLVSFPDQASFTSSTDNPGYTTLFAQWSSTSHALVFSPVEGSGSMDSLILATGSVQTLPANGFTRLGHSFSGWSSSFYGAVEYANEAEFTMPNENKTLYAQWTPNSVNIVFNPNGGTGTMSAQSVQAGASVSLNPNAFTRTGYSFVGWSISPSAQASYLNQGNFNMPIDRTVGFNLYAQWSSNIYSLSFSPMGGTGNMASINLIAGNTYTLPANGFSRSGYVFAGWSNDPLGTVHYANQASLTMPSMHKTLYAQWRSTNANLASIEPSVGRLYPSFSPTTLSYSLGLTGASTSVRFLLSLEDSSSTMSVPSSWNSSLVYGTNTKAITVTAASGATRTYTIRVYQGVYSSSIGNLMYVPAGSFSRGGSNTVGVSAILMSQCEITQAQFANRMSGYNPSYYPGDLSRPVDSVNWYAAVEFCNRQSSAEGRTPVYSITDRSPATGYPITSATVSVPDWTVNGYRLPTQLEWYWAAIGAIEGGYYAVTFSGYEPLKISDDYAWHGGNSGGSSHSVGQKLANALGIFDMSGNVFEFVWDWYGTIPSTPLVDYRGPDTGTSKCSHGGYFMIGPTALYTGNYTSAGINNGYSFVGFRVVRLP